MNILFVLYGDLTSNSAHPLALYAREFSARGHQCVVAIPNNLGSARQHPQAAIEPVLFADALAQPEAVFANGQPADLVHAWTPRENVRQFVNAYMALHPAPLVVYLEDHERWISCRALGLDETTVCQHTEQSLSQRLPAALSHPFWYRRFIALADMLVLIQDKLRVDAPAWVLTQTVLPGVDLNVFRPDAHVPGLRQKLGLANDEWVIVYPGGLNDFTRHGIQSLCLAVGLINARGYKCRLLRTGPYALDFIDSLPPEAAAAVTDLGEVPRHELPGLLALAGVLVQPGKFDPFEDLRLPGKLPELLAMGRPVLMPDANIAHLLTDGVDAVITRTGTPQEIADRCIELLTNPAKATEMGRNGRRFAEKHFDIKVQAVRLETAYELAIQAFDPKLSASIWQARAAEHSVNHQYVRKLEYLATLQNLPSHVTAIDLMSDLADSAASLDARVAGLEAALGSTQQHASNLQALIDCRDQHIAELKAVLAHKDVENHSTHLKLQDYDALVTSLKQQLSERDQLLAGQNGTLQAIKNSLSWKLTAPLRLLSRL